MRPLEIKTGLAVCTTHKGAAFCNTTVIRYPVAGYPGHALLDGIDEPYPISELKPFTTGLIDPATLKSITQSK